MAPLQGEASIPVSPAIPNAKAFVRSLNVLLKYARLYGLQHSRSADQFEAAWKELRDAVAATSQGGLLLGASGSQLLLDGVPVDSSQAERSFADFLTNAGVASIGFLPRVERDEFVNLVKCFMETGPNAGPLADRLAEYFGGKKKAGVRGNEIRFSAEDAGFSDARVAATLTAKTLGADADKIQDWFRSPEKMIQLIAAAEGEHGGAGVPGTAGSGGIGTGTGYRAGTTAGTGAGAGWGAGAGSGAGTAAALGPGIFGTTGLCSRFATSIT